MRFPILITKDSRLKTTLTAGFTLIELMVSLTLFTVIVLAAVSSLYSVNNASRKVSSMRAVLDNLNFAVDDITRTVRTGTVPTCGGAGNSTTDRNCSFGDDSYSDHLSVQSTLGRSATVEFRLTTDENNIGRIEKRVNSGGVWEDWVAMTAPEINVSKLAFYVDGANADDLAQPSVIILVQGIASSNADTTAPFAIQTYVSQRTAE